jgi:AbrB family looped-hinge helix DNA binding protein
MYQTKLTSQGTVSLPATLRRKHNLRPGDVLTIEDVGDIRLVVNMSLSDMRKKNQAYTKVSPVYTQGDGFAAHIKERYGKK